MTRSHKEEVQGIRQGLAAIGGTVWVTHQGSGPRRAGGRRGLWGSSGIPDLICRWRDKFFFIEVKVGKDRLRPAQAEFIEAARECGVDVVVGGMTDVLAYLGLASR